MNGDTGKLSAGAVYPNSPESIIGGNTSSGASMTASNISGITTGVIQSQTLSQNNSTDIATMNGAENDGSDSSGRGATKSPEINPIPLDQLKQLLSAQLDYYFSRENLANDTYLLTQMDNDQYVPIWTVANFNQVKKLTKDLKLITEVLRESPNVQVDEEGLKVRPNHKRCIVILREIPDNTPIEEVKNLFSGENCPRFISCEFAHNNSWYITFESDDDAQRAYRYLREEIKEFQGKQIMARIKAKPMNRALPIAPVQIPMKNGYRTTPPPAVFDPTAAAFTTQQRFVYANGAPLPQGAVPYSGQVPMFPFQQQQYYPGIMPPWPAAPPPPSQNYYELGSVFAANGLSPQVSFAAKPTTSRYNNHRSNMRKRTQNTNEHRSTSSNDQNQNAHQQQSHNSSHRSINTNLNQTHHQHHSITQQQQQQQQQNQIQQSAHHYSQQQSQHAIFHQHSSTNPNVTKIQQTIIAYGGAGINNNNSNNNNQNNSGGNINNNNSNLKSNDIHGNKYITSKEERNLTQSTSHVPQHSQSHYHSAQQPPPQHHHHHHHHHQQDISNVHDNSNNQISSKINTDSDENTIQTSHRTSGGGGGGGGSSKEQWPRYRRRRKDDDSNQIVRSTNINSTTNPAQTNHQTKVSASPNISSSLRETNTNNSAISGGGGSMNSGNNSNTVGGTSGGIAAHTNNSRTAQFDLEASAFPPLPGLDQSPVVPILPGGQSNQIIINIKSSQIALETQPEVINQTNIVPTPQAAWGGENRLADVVKGTARTKSKSSDKEINTRSNSSSPPLPNVNQNELNSQSITASIQSLNISSTNDVPTINASNDTVLHNSIVALTPPFSPDTNNKLNPPVINYSTADKSTKTDESLLNGSDSCKNVTGNQISLVPPSPNSTACPISLQAATMTPVEGTILPATSPIQSSPFPLSSSSNIIAATPSTNVANKTQTQSKTQINTAVSKSSSNNKLVMSSTSQSVVVSSQSSSSINNLHNISSNTSSSNNNNNSCMLRSTSPNIIQNAIPTGTQTIVVAPVANIETNSVRLSYAQVAQHHKERLLKDKQNNESSSHSGEKDNKAQQPIDKDNKRVESPPNARVSSQYNDSRERGDNVRDNTRHGNSRKEREHRNSGGANTNNNNNLNNNNSTRRDGVGGGGGGGGESSGKNRSNRNQHHQQNPKESRTSK